MIFDILIVDDSSTMRSVVKRLLNMTTREIGCCYEAANGREAIDLLNQHSVDLVIADLNMPEMDGETMIRKIREDEQLASLPIVIVSTDGSADRIRRLRELGVKACLQKPFTHEVLSDVICMIFENEAESHPIAASDRIGDE